MPDKYLAAPGTAAAPDAAVDATTVDEAPAGVTPATTPAPVAAAPADDLNVIAVPQDTPPVPRSEEHTSELQSLMRISYAVFCLKKTINTQDTYRVYTNDKKTQ